MDLGTQFIFLVIFGISGFVIGKLTGFNPYTLVADLGTVGFVGPLLIFSAKVSIDPSYSFEATSELINWYVNNLPGTIIGTLAGNVVGAFTGR